MRDPNSSSLEMFHNVYSMSSSTTTPTRPGRGVALPTIDTRAPVARPMSSLASNGMLTPPQTGIESRRGSLAYSSLSDGSMSNAPSMGAYSMPSTPLHYNDPFSQPATYPEGPHLTASGGLQIHISQQENHDAKLYSSLYGGVCEPDRINAMVPHGLQGLGQDMSGLYQNHASMVQDPCLASQGLGAHASTSPSAYWPVSQAYPSYPPAQQDMSYCQPAQVVMPGQISPAEDWSVQGNHSFAAPDNCGDRFTSSFYSTDSSISQWDHITPPSPDQMYTCDSDDDDWANVKREPFGFSACHQTSPTPKGTARITKPLPYRTRRRSCKRGKSNISRTHVVHHGAEIIYEGNWQRDENDIPIKPVVGTPSAAKPHVCAHLDEATGLTCSRSFERSEHLKRHHTMHEPKDKRRYPCPLEGCKQTISRSDNAGDHFKTHLKGPRKGQRNRFFTWDVVRATLLENYEEKEAHKMIVKIEKWIRECGDGKDQRFYLGFAAGEGC